MPQKLTYMRERVAAVVAEAAERDQQDEARRWTSVSLPDMSLKGESLARVRAGRGGKGL